MKCLLSLILVLSPLYSAAEDLIPFQMDSSKGEMGISSQEELLYIDNRTVYLRSDEQGKFEGVFLYKLKNLEETPQLDLRVRLNKGALSVRIHDGTDWVEIGKVLAKTDYQRLHFSFINNLSQYAKNGVVKVKVVSLEKTDFAEVDYIGISTDQFIDPKQTASTGN